MLPRYSCWGENYAGSSGLPSGHGPFPVPQQSKTNATGGVKAAKNNGGFPEVRVVRSKMTKAPNTRTTVTLTTTTPTATSSTKTTKRTATLPKTAEIAKTMTLLDSTMARMILKQIINAVRTLNFKHS